MGLDQGQHNASPIILPDGATAPLQVDGSGNLEVTGAVTSTDATLDATVSGGRVQTTEASGAGAKADLDTLVGAAAAPASATAIITANTLPGSGAYETAPTTSSSTGVAIPTGTVAKPTRGATIIFNYTQGTSGGAMAAKFWAYDGTEWGQIPSPVDQSYSGYALGAGSGRYEISIDLRYGVSRIFVTGAETGVTGTPGTYSAEVVFG